MIVIGVGNDFRHDDAAGLIAARRLRELGVDAETHEGDPLTLMDRWKGSDDLILIDAVVSGAVPGTLHCLDASHVPLPAEMFKASTHVLGLADAIELSRALNMLPPRVVVFGVEARDTTPGIGLSREVECALPRLVDAIYHQGKFVVGSGENGV